MIWGDVVQSVISGWAIGMTFSVFVRGSYAEHFFLIYVVSGDGLGVFGCCVGFVCAWLPYIGMLVYTNCDAREGGTFQLWGVRVLSEGVNVVHLYTDWKISPIRYGSSQNNGTDC